MRRWILGTLPLATALACGGSGDGDRGAAADADGTASADDGQGPGTADPNAADTVADQEGPEGPDDDGPDDDAGTAATDGGEPPELVAVSHERELRAAWIATVYNINFPSAQGMSVTAMQEELQAFVDVAAATHLNALILQVRPEADALYASDLEPWSRYLTGTQGDDPGFDPLLDFIERAHAQGIEVHAWLNPYRAAANNAVPVADSHVASQFPQYAYEYGSLLWMDPGAQPVQQHDVDVILDIVDRYDVDGIHFDDYFYPYPDGSPFPDGSSYGAYEGPLSLDDWRRDNVNGLVELLHDEIGAAKPWVRFGISPFGIYQPGMPPGITGLNQYAELFADPVVWIQEGWVDYLAPQLYWPTTQTAQAYEPLVEWWVSIAPEGRNIFVGNYLSQLGSSASWDVDELLDQVELSRQYQLDSPGNIFYQIEPLMNDLDGIATTLATETYPFPVLPPPLWERRDDTIAPPAVAVEGTAITLTPGDDAELRAWVVYRDEGGTFVLDHIAPRAWGDTIELEPGRWAVTAAAKSEVESLGVVVEL